MTQEYDAFISYASTPDAVLARKLEAFLERINKNIDPEVRPPIELKICLDGSDFDLSKEVALLEGEDKVRSVLSKYLAMSKSLIVLCSYGAVKSDDVNWEIEWFLKHRPDANVYIIVTEGSDPVSSPESVFPQALLNRQLHKKIWIDFRGAERKRKKNAVAVRNYEEARLILAASLMGKTVGEISPGWFRIKRKELKKRARIAYAAAVIMAILVVLTGYFWRSSEANRIEAERNARLDRGRRLAAEALQTVDKSPLKAYSLAVEGLEINWKETTPPSELMLALWTSLEGMGGWQLEVGNDEVDRELIAYSPKSTLVAYKSINGVVIWKLPENPGDTPVQLLEIDTDSLELTQLLFLDEEKLMVAGEGTLYTCDLSTRPIKKNYWPDPPEVFELGEFNGQKQLTIALEDDQIVLRQMPLGSEPVRLSLNETVKDIAVIKSSRYLFAETERGMIRYDLKKPERSPELVLTAPTRIGYIRQDASPDASVIVASDFNILRVSHKQPNGQWKEREPLVCSGIISSVHWSPSGEYAAVGADHSLIIVPKDFDKPIRVIENAHGEWVMSVLHNDHGTLFTSGADGMVRTWGKNPGETPPSVFFISPNPANQLAHSNNHIIAASQNTNLALLVEDEIGEIHTEFLKALDATWSGLTFSPSGRWLTASDELGQVRLWDMTKPRSGSALALAVADQNPGGSESTWVGPKDFAIVHDTLGVVRVCDLFSGEVTKELKGHTSGYLDGVWYNASNDWLLTFDFEDGLRRWDKPYYANKNLLDLTGASIDGMFNNDGSRFFFLNVNGVSWWPKEVPGDYQPKMLEQPLILDAGDGLKDIVVFDMVLTVMGRESQTLAELYEKIGSIAERVLIDPTNKRVFAEITPGNVQLWYYGNEELALTHELSNETGMLSGNLLFTDYLIKGALPIQNENEQIELWQPLEGGQWDITTLESAEAEIEYLEFKQGNRVVARDIEGGIWHWDISDLKAGKSFGKKLATTSTSSFELLSERLILTEDEHSTQLTLWHWQEEGFVPVILPEFDSQIDEFWYAWESNTLVVLTEDGIIRSIPLGIDAAISKGRFRNVFQGLRK